MRTHRLAGLPSFLLLALLVLGGLRLLHLTIPAFYPKVLAGPFSLQGVEEVEAYAGYSPLVPFYRPEVLGERPVNVTVTRRPRPRVVIFWYAEHFLRLEQELGGDEPSVPADSRPLDGEIEARWWRQGKAIHAVAKSGEVWVELTTDLDLEEVERVLHTLRPYATLR